MSSLHTVNKNIPILIVDNASSVRKSVKQALVQLGFKNLSEAESGEAALEKLQEEECSLIMSDLDMQGMNGMDFLKQIRAHEQFGSVPFVMMAGSAEKEVVVEAVQAGVSNYMVKPFTVEDVREKLEMIAGKLK